MQQMRLLQPTAVQLACQEQGAVNGRSFLFRMARAISDAGRQQVCFGGFGQIVGGVCRSAFGLVRGFLQVLGGCLGLAVSGEQQG